MELDQLDRIAAEAFEGYIVRKDLVRKFARQYPVPTYVCEFLLGRYCASTNVEEIQEGLQIVERQLRGRAVRSGEEELFKSRAKETGSVKLIDVLRARLDARNDCYIAELPSLNLRDVRIDDQMVKDHERMTAGIECRKDADVIDETPAAYKSIEDVMAAQADLVEVVQCVRLTDFEESRIDFGPGGRLLSHGPLIVRSAGKCRDEGVAP